MEFNLSLISKYRTQLMGVAMLWVMLFHSKLPISNDLLSFISRTGYGGVDIFLLLSGLGIFFSLDKDSDTLSFYKRRALRILPYYLPIILLYSVYLCIAFKLSPSFIFYKLTTLSFWLNINDVGYEWYIPSLIGVYLISPFYVKIFKKKPYVVTIISLLISVLFSVLINDSEFSYLLIFTTRLPIYFIGVLTAFYIKCNKKIGLGRILILFFSFIVGCCALYFILKNAMVQYGLLWYSFVLIVPFLLIIFSSFFSLTRSYSFPVLSFLGKYSLVIYLLHEKIINYVTNTGFAKNINIFVLIFVLFLSTLLIAYIYQNSIEKMINVAKNRANKI